MHFHFKMWIISLAVAQWLSLDPGPGSGHMPGLYYRYLPPPPPLFIPPAPSLYPPAKSFFYSPDHKNNLL